MTKKIIFLVIVFIGLGLILKMQINHQKDNEEEIGKSMSEISITPISHASLILSWEGLNIYADPVGEADMFNGKEIGMFDGKPAPDIILLTDIHGDHFDVPTLKKLAVESTIIIAPQAVADMIPEELKSKTTVMKNGETKEFLEFKIEAVPMYNLPGPSENYHTKGRGNGYIITIPARVGVDAKRIYISGDSAGTPEMRALQNIDIAFVAMNLPYTMDPVEAASAVLDFKPEQVYPYHYRQNPTKDFADVAKFKELVNSQNPDIQVIQLDWYPKS